MSKPLSNLRLVFADIKQVNVDATLSKAKPPPQKCICSRYDLDLSPLTLRIFSAFPTHMIYICAKASLKSIQKLTNLSAQKQV